MLKLSPKDKAFKEWLIKPYPEGRGLLWVKKITNMELMKVRRDMLKSGYLKEHYPNYSEVFFDW